jgi:hypothetical protein
MAALGTGCSSKKCQKMTDSDGIELAVLNSSHQCVFDSPLLIPANDDGKRRPELSRAWFT